MNEKSFVVPANAGTHNHRCRCFASAYLSATAVARTKGRRLRVPALAGTTMNSCYSHFFHLKNTYGSTAASSIMTSAIG
jgi:hypothetical protein